MMEQRLAAARAATRGAGAGIMALRGTPMSGREADRHQLKTPADTAAEGWVVGYLRSCFPEDQFLSEEDYDASAGDWAAPDEFWTVDALDGTRSFIEGFDGFCVQVAFISDGEVMLGVVYEPVTESCYWAAKGAGAFVAGAADAPPRRLELSRVATWPPNPRFVDSRRPVGPVGGLMEEKNGSLVECGSFGLKFCRVADATADVFAKDVSAALWDAAPGSLIIQEAGGVAARWDGTPLRFATREVYFDDLLVAPAGLFDLASRNLLTRRTSANG